MNIFKIKIIRVILLCLYHFNLLQISFYYYALKWHLNNTTPKNITTKNILELFYYDFLNVPIEDCEIIEITDNKLTTRCKNVCPILEFSKEFSLDTKKSCKRLSEGPCKFFLKKLDKNIIFERNYDHIRPYKKNCEETIIIKKKEK